MKQSLADKIRSLAKGQSRLVHVYSNVAKVTAHRVLGKGRYRVKTVGLGKTRVWRTK